MANLNPTPGWDAVPQLEKTTQAKGGVGGPMNSQAQALLNRTEQLKNSVDALPSKQYVDSSTSNLALSLATNGATTGSTMVAYGAWNVSKILDGARIPIEAFGAKGDYNPLTQTGTDDSAAFNAAAQSGRKIQLKPNTNYMISADIVLASGTDFFGDDSYSPKIYPKKSTGGLKMIRTPTTGTTQLTNISLRGFTVARIGLGAEHGVLIDNVDGLIVDLQVISDGFAAGGAIGIAPFQPYHRAVTNFDVKAKVVNSGDFGLQLGNAQNGTVDIFAQDCYREVLGFEPICTRSISIPAASISGNSITLANHGLSTGQPLIYDRRANTAALSKVAYWFVIKVDNNTFQLADSKADAYAGIASTIGSWTGTHIFYVCSIIDGVQVRSCVIRDRKSLRPPSFANTTGYVILTANSGGWIGDVGLPIIQIEGFRELTDVTTSGIRIEGVQHTRIGQALIVGCDDAVQFRNGFLNGMRDTNGNNLLDSNYPVTMTPSNNTIGDLRSTSFNSAGIRAIDGRNFVKSGVISSNKSAAIGIVCSSLIDTLPEFSNFDINVPNGTPWDAVPLGSNNRNRVSGQLVTRMDRYNYRSSIRKSVISGGIVCGLKPGSTEPYSGTLEIVARNSNVGAANTARYVIDVSYAYTGVTPTVTLIRSSGLTTGGSSNHPSFTFSISSGNLIATAVASTSTTAAFEFFVIASGDLFIG